MAIWRPPPQPQQRAVKAVISGWANISQVKGIAAASISHKKGVAVASISHIKGVAV
jgi:hypothetical protein